MSIEFVYYKEDEYGRPIHYKVLLDGVDCGRVIPRRNRYTGGDFVEIWTRSGIPWRKHTNRTASTMEEAKAVITALLLLGMHREY